MSRCGGEPFAVEDDRAGVRRQETQQQANGRRFACAIWPEEPVDRAGTHREIETIDGNARRKRASQPLGLNRQGVGHNYAVRGAERRTPATAVAAAPRNKARLKIHETTMLLPKTPPALDQNAAGA